MRNKYFRNIPLYLITLSTIVYAAGHGFSWLTIVAIVLAVIVLIWDCVDFIRRKK